MEKGKFKRKGVAKNMRTKKLCATFTAFALLLGIAGTNVLPSYAEENNTADTVLIAQQNDEAENVQLKEYLPSEQPNGMSVIASAAEGVLPDDAILIVKQLGSMESSYLDTTIAMEENNVEYENVLMLDIGFQSGGEEIEPENGTVSIQMEVDPALLPNDVDANSISIYHLNEEDNELETVVGEGFVNVNEENKVVAEFEVSSFSPFAITFKTGNSTTDLVDYYGNKLSLDQYNSMLQVMKNQLETKWTDSITKITNLPITDWTRSSVPAKVYRPDVAADDAESATEITWVWDDVKNIQTDITDAAKVWDGSRLQLIDDTYSTEHYLTDYLPENAITADASSEDNCVLYDSATWVHKYPAENGGRNSYSMYRFTGTFDIGDTNPNDYAYTVKPVTMDVEGNKIYLNDDIYVFIYPQGTTLTNDNFMNYLAFWSGTSTNTLSRKDDDGTILDDIKFHGRSATKAQKAGAAADLDGFWKLTDGWNMPAVTDNAGGVMANAYKENSTETTYVIDVFTTDYQTGGGMYRLKMDAIVIKKAEIRFEKVDEESRTPLSGAVFTLEKDGVYYEATSDADGIVEFHAVPGTYTLKEKSAPENYNLTDTTWTIEVYGNDNGDATGEYKITNNSTGVSVTQDEKTVDVYEIENNAGTKELTVSKNVTGNVADLSQEFEFTLTLKNRAGSSYTETLTATGKATSLTAVDGKYTFKLKDDEQITITIPYGYEYTVTETDYSDIGYKTTINNGASVQNSITATLSENASVQYTNHRDALIDTGVETTSLNNYVLILTSVVILLGVFAITSIYRRKRFF